MTPYVMCQLCQFTDITDTVTRALIYPPSHFSALHVPMEAEENTPEQLHETVARLREWMDAAEAVPDPPERLGYMLEETKAVMQIIELTRAGTLDGLEPLIRAFEGYLEDLSEEVLRIRDERRSRGNRLLAQAGMIDLTLPMEDLITQLTGEDAEAWNEAPSGHRKEAGRRYHLLQETRELNTADLKTFAEGYRGETGEDFSVATRYRWQKALQEDGIIGLLPDW